MPATMIIVVALLLSFGVLGAAEPGALTGIRRIVFLGDSITQAGDYVTDVECWLRSQGRTYDIISLGLGSESGTDLTDEENAGHKKKYGFPHPLLSERLGRLLDATHPDLVFACYGMNDAGELPVGEVGVGRYVQAMKALREKLLAAGAKRVVLCTPPVADPKNRSAPDARVVNLAAYNAALIALRSAGVEVVDIHGPMRQALDAGIAAKPEFRFAADGVHPNREGHWVMAKAILTQFFAAPVEGVANAEALFPAKGAEIRKLLVAKRTVLFNAYMTRIGHTRPGVVGHPEAKPGLPIDQATAKAAELDRQVEALLRP